MPHHGRTLALFLVTAPALACDSSTESLPREIRPASIEIVAADDAVPAGGSVTLMAVVLNADGDTIPDPDIDWSSDDSDIARVSDDGVVSARLPGDVDIVASAGSVEDEVTLEVGMPDAAPGTAALYVDGPSGRWLRTWHGDVQHDDLFHPAAVEGLGDVTSLLVGSDPAGARDTIFAIFRDGYLYTAQWGVGPFLSSEADAPIVYLLISENGEIEEIWGSETSGTLDLEAEMPARPSLQPGFARGTLDARLRRVVIDDAGFASYGTQTIDVVLSFDLPFYRVPLPYIDLALGGGPIPSEPNVVAGLAYGDGADGLLLQVLANYDADASLFDARFTLRIDTIPHAFNVGSNRVLDAISPATYADPATWPGAFVAVEYREFDDLLLAHDGQEMGLRFYLPANDVDYGRVDLQHEWTVERYSATGSSMGSTVVNAWINMPVGPGSPDPRTVQGMAPPQRAAERFRPWRPGEAAPTATRRD